MSAITVLKQNIPHGPFTRAEVTDQLSRGEISPDSLAFVEGLTQWTPLREVLAKVDAAAAPAPPPVATMPIGTGYGPVGTVSVGASAPIGTGYSYAATMQPPGHLVYAGFWLRFAAIFIDGLILLPLSLVSLGLSAMTRSIDDNTTKIILGVIMLGYAIVVIVVRWLYFALQESSKYQATVGKRVMGITVTNRQGERISFGRASGRYFGKIISSLTLCVGFMMAGWTQRKQALHDMLADTLVVQKPGA